MEGSFFPNNNASNQAKLAKGDETERRFPRQPLHMLVHHKSSKCDSANLAIFTPVAFYP